MNDNYLIEIDGIAVGEKAVYQKIKYGSREGDICNRNGCKGVMVLDDVENCSCHLRATCCQCFNRDLCCQVCGLNESGL